MASFFSRNTKSTPPMISFSELAAPRWGRNDGPSLLRDGYMGNCVVYRCVRLIAESITSIPFETDNADLAKLMASPHPSATQNSFLSTLVSHWQVAGNGFAQAVTLPGETVPKALFPIRPDRMKPVYDGQGWVDGWAIRNKQGESHIMRDVEDWLPVLHIRTSGPEDGAMGHAPLAAARKALDLHNATSDWSKALLDNSAKPSGALIYSGSDGKLSDHQFTRLRDELTNKFSGPENAGRPLLLEGGMEWQPMSLTPAEMDFLALRHDAAREIALALGVPPMLLGIPGDNTYSNYKEANLAFWRMTILPLAKNLAEALSIWLGPKFGDAVLKPNTETVPAFQGDRDALWKRVGAADFLTDDEKRKILGLETV